MATLTSRPGGLVVGAAAFGLASWLGILALVASVPGLEPRTWLSVLAMVALFGVLLAVHLASSIRVAPEGLAARTLLRVVRCDWDAVRRIEIQALLPGFRLYLVSTARGVVVFSSLWRRHRELCRELRERAGLD